MAKMLFALYIKMVESKEKCPLLKKRHRFWENKIAHKIPGTWYWGEWDRLSITWRILPYVGGSWTRWCTPGATQFKAAATPGSLSHQSQGMHPSTPSNLRTLSSHGYVHHLFCTGHWSQVCGGLHGLQALSPGGLHLGTPLFLHGLARSTESTGSQDQVKVPCSQVFHKCFLYADFSGPSLYISCGPFSPALPLLSAAHDLHLIWSIPPLL